MIEPISILEIPKHDERLKPVCGIETLPGGWISVKDRLPEVPEGADAVQVLIYYECPVTHKKGIETDYFWRDSIVLNGEDASGFEYVGITHWMPLPAPPEHDHYVINTKLLEEENGNMDNNNT